MKRPDEDDPTAPAMQEFIVKIDTSLKSKQSQMMQLDTKTNILTDILQKGMFCN
jgi:hypothetical protein